MRIYDTLGKQLKELPAPEQQKEIKMFVCGPTVYDYTHLGNARTFVIFDVVAKYLKHKGYDVRYIQNITDIDNKIIERAEREGVNPDEHARKYAEIFKQDMAALGVTSPEYKNATDHIPEVIAQVQKLIDTGHAYAIENDGIYFDLSTFPEYGKLSGRTAEMADDAVSRIDDSDRKRNRGDFALWKFKQHNDPSWPAPFGEGRPGWHIEDTAITEKYFGAQYDIHGGGQDLKFPHHEAEIAQQESASGLKPFVKIWMHTGFLVNKEEKMSKSAGNFETLREVLKKYEKGTLRMYFLSAHYRSPLSYSETGLAAIVMNIASLREFRNRLALIKNTKHETNVDEIKEMAKKAKEAIENALDNDFNSSEAFAAFFDFINKINKLFDEKKLGGGMGSILSVVDLIDRIFGIIPSDTNYLENLPQEVLNLINSREEARKNKDWEKSDELRDKLKKMGHQIDDTPYGPSPTGPAGVKK